MSLLDLASVPRLAEGPPRAPGMTAFTPALLQASNAAPHAFFGKPPRVDFLRPDELSPAERARWAKLSEHAAPGNIFAADWFMRSALHYCGGQWSLRLAVVRHASGTWLGVLPLTLEHRTAGAPVPGYHGWRAAEQFIGTPLVRAGAERVFWQALLARLDKRPGLALGLSCGVLPVNDPVTLALTSLCAEHGRRVHLTNSFSRPARLPGSAADPKAARRLDRRLDALETRLATALGPVSLVLHDRREDCEPWLAAFFALERARNKGAGDRALARCPRALSLLRDVIRHGHRDGTVRLASLTAGERIVAMTSWFIAEGHGYGFKMVFDEAWRSYAPRRLLMRRVARALESKGPLLFDTCAMPDAPHDPLWPDRRAFAGIAIGIGSRPRRALFDALVRGKAVEAR